MVAPTPGTGLEVDVLFAGDFKTVIGKLHNVQALAASKVLSDVGNGAVSLPLDDPTLGAPLPPGVSSTTLVRQQGTFTDDFTRANQFGWYTTTIPGTQRGFVDVQGYEQYMQGYIPNWNPTGSPATRNVRFYFWYTSDSDCVYIDIGFNGQNTNGSIHVMSGGTDLAAALSFHQAGTYLASVAGGTGTQELYFIAQASKRDRKVELYIAGPGNRDSYAHTFGLTDTDWTGFTPGTQIGYDTTVAATPVGTGTPDAASNKTLGTNNSFTMTTSGGHTLSGGFMVTGQRTQRASDDWKPTLGTFPGLGKSWYHVLWTDRPASTSLMALPNEFQTPMMLYGNRIMGHWTFQEQADATLTTVQPRSTAMIDLGTADGTWQAVLGVNDTVLDASKALHTLLIRCNPDATDGFVVGWQNASPGYSIFRFDTLSSATPAVPVDTPNDPAHAAQTWAPGDILRVDLAGSSIKIYRNSTLLGAHADTHYQTQTVFGVNVESYDTNTSHFRWWTPDVEDVTGKQRGYIESVSFIGTTDVWVTATPANLLADENVFVIRKDGRTVLAFLNEQPDESVIGDDSSQVKKVTVKGRGIGAVLEWGKVLPPGWPTPIGDDHTYDTVHAMDVWLRLLAECQGRDTLLFVTPTFTATADTNGVPWPDINDLTESPGTDMLSLLVKYQALVGFDWQARLDETTGTVYVDAWMAYGTNRTGTVVFWPAFDITQQTRNRDRTVIGNYIAAKGQPPGADVGIYASAQDAGSIGRWRKRELWVDAGDAKTTNQTRLVAAAALSETGREYASLTSQVVVDQAGRVMFEDYDYGDTVYVNTDDASMDGPYRVIALSLTASDENISGEITLQSRRDLRILAVQKLLNRLGASGIGPSVATPI